MRIKGKYIKIRQRWYRQTELFSDKEPATEFNLYEPLSVIEKDRNKRQKILKKYQNLEE